MIIRTKDSDDDDDDNDVDMYFMYKKFLYKERRDEALHYLPLQHMQNPKDSDDDNDRESCKVRRYIIAVDRQRLKIGMENV